MGERPLRRNGATPEVHRRPAPELELAAVRSASATPLYNPRHARGSGGTRSTRPGPADRRRWVRPWRGAPRRRAAAEAAAAGSVWAVALPSFVIGALLALWARPQALAGAGRAAPQPRRTAPARGDARPVAVAQRCRAPAAAAEGPARRRLAGRRRPRRAAVGPLHRDRHRHAARAPGWPPAAAGHRCPLCTRRRGRDTPREAARPRLRRRQRHLRGLRGHAACARRPAAGGRRCRHGNRARIVQLHRLARPACADPRGRRLHADPQGGLRPRARPHRQRPPRPRARRGGAHEQHDRRAADAVASCRRSRWRASRSTCRSWPATSPRTCAASRPSARWCCTSSPACRSPGDPTLLRLVLENLLGNAWKYTGKCRAPRRSGCERRPQRAAVRSPCATTAPASTCASPTGCSACSSACTAPATSRARASAWLGAPHRAAPWRRDLGRGRGRPRRELSLHAAAGLSRRGAGSAAQRLASCSVRAVDGQRAAVSTAASRRSACSPSAAPLRSAPAAAGAPAPRRGQRIAVHQHAHRHRHRVGAAGACRCRLPAARSPAGAGAAGTRRASMCAKAASTAGTICPMSSGLTR